MHAGREKHHLRLAVSDHLPHRIAWRRKVAVHHGGGLQAGVIKLLAADAQEWTAPPSTAPVSGS
ncbi:hypothetical protein [Micromonospora endophytica]|uniref:hypothetical protein n=1 Tax=Micromonospora endophytica TaxID=515350 RepID=UPI003B8A89B5